MRAQGRRGKTRTRMRSPNSASPVPQLGQRVGHRAPQEATAHRSTPHVELHIKPSRCGGCRNGCNGCNGCTRRSLGFAGVRSPDQKPQQTGEGRGDGGLFRIDRSLDRAR